MEKDELDIPEGLSGSERAKYRLLVDWLEDMRNAYEVYKRGVMKRTGCPEDKIFVYFVQE